MKMLPLCVAIFGVLPAITTTAFVFVSHIFLRRWLLEKAPASRPESNLPPVTFFRPLKAGVPELHALLSAHAAALRPDDQLLLGVAPGTDAARTAEEIRAHFPEREIVVITCDRAAAANPKISKLLQMESAARHGAWIIADGEARLDAAFLTDFRSEWREGETLTAGYSFPAAETWAQRLDAAASLLTLWPGLAVLRATGRVRLTLGACTAVFRDNLAEVGGWAAFAHDLAEDHRLGAALAAAGTRVRLSRSVVSLGSDPLSWRAYRQHQRRMAVTYRVANPAGFAGVFLIQGVTTSLLCLLVSPAVWSALLFAAVLLLRTWQARRLASLLDLQAAPTIPLIFFASLVETSCWASAWFSRAIFWSGRRWSVSRAGHLRELL